MQSKFKITTAKKDEILDITANIQDTLSKQKLENNGFYLCTAQPIRI